MKLNDIKFLPKANAVADVYAEATGMPIVGEMMVAAAGQGGNPAQPNPIETVKMHYDGEGSWYAYIWMAEWFMEEYGSDIANVSVCGTIFDENGDEVYSDLTQDNYGVDSEGFSGAMPYYSSTFPAESGTYEILVYTEFEAAEPTYTAHGNWTMDE